MRASTWVVVGVNNVGKADQDPEIFEGPLKESLTKMLNKLAKESMAKRFQIVIARDIQEVMVGLSKQPSRRNDSKLSNALGLLDELEFNDFPAEGERGDCFAPREPDESQNKRSEKIERSPLDDYNSGE